MKWAPAIALATMTIAAHASATEARVVIVDDGERIARDQAKPLAKSAWLDPAEITLFAMRGETVAIQVVIEAGDRDVKSAHATLGPLLAPSTTTGATLDARVETFAEQFVEVKRPTRNQKDGTSLAFTAASAPSPAAFTGFFADALVPAADVEAHAHERAAIWIDLTIPRDAPPGTYVSSLDVSSDDGAIATRTLRLRVLKSELPYPAAKTMIYYDPKNLERRMGSRNAERALRFLLHAHHLSAIHDVRDARDLGFDARALTGEAFTPAEGYEGAGEGIGEGVFAIGSYGSLGEPTRAALSVVEKIMNELRAHAGAAAIAKSDVFVYAIDETCASPWGGQWIDLLRRSDAARGVRVGATCGDDPMNQRVNLVIMTAPDLSPTRARIAKAAGKWLWAYNGQRPYAGPMMLDVPATDLRANAWIAARYGIDRWFYWESTYWFDDINGGRGGARGFDPYVTAETFHNQDGDAANLDGVLVYPGTQRGGGAGMRDFGVETVFPSVRLKNLRRGIEDAGYIELARRIDRDAADAIVARVIPRALASAGDRAAWSDVGASWLEARSELAAIVEPAEAQREAAATPAREAARAKWRIGCDATSASGEGAPRSLLVACAMLFLAGNARRSSSRRRSAHEDPRSRAEKEG